MDRRDEMAAHGSLLPAGARVDTNTMTLTFTAEDNDGEVEHTLPCRWEVCPTCDGNGTHVNPSIDAHGLTREDFDDDPGFAEDYHGGVYNVICYECGGRRVVAVPDENRSDPAVLKTFNDEVQAEADYRAICAAERRAEGWY